MAKKNHGEPYTVEVRDVRRLKCKRQYFWTAGEADSYAASERAKGYRVRVLQSPADFFQGERP